MDTSDGRCRDTRGVIAADGDPSSPLACYGAAVAVSGDWGTAPGPALLSAVADDVDDLDAALGAGDTLTLTFDQPTDRAGAAPGAALDAAAVDAMVVFRPTLGELGHNYSGAWVGSDTLQITIGAAIDDDAALMSAAGKLRVTCLPAGASPIRDAAARMLPSACAANFTGDFGVYL